MKNKNICFAILVFAASLIVSFNVLAQKEDNGWSNMLDGKTLNGGKQLLVQQPVWLRTA